MTRSYPHGLLRGRNGFGSECLKDFTFCLFEVRGRRLPPYILHPVKLTNAFLVLCTVKKLFASLRKADSRLAALFCRGEKLDLPSYTYVCWPLDRQGATEF